MSANPEQRPAEVRRIRDTREELDRVLRRLDETLSALKVEIADVQRVIDEREH